MMLCLASCTPKASSTLTGVANYVDLGDETEVELNETIGVQSMNGTFTFVEVFSDSRCPEGVNCIQAGEATVTVQLAGGEQKRVTIPADMRRAERVVSGDLVYNITALTPYPKQGKVIDAEDYRLVVNATALRD